MLFTHIRQLLTQCLNTCRALGVNTTRGVHTTSSEWSRSGAGARVRLADSAGTVVAIGISKRWRVLDWCASVLVSSGQRLGLACLVCVVVRYGVGGLSISSRVLSHISLHSLPNYQNIRSIYQFCRFIERNSDRPTAPRGGYGSFEVFRLVSTRAPNGLQ